MVKSRQINNVWIVDHPAAIGHSYYLSSISKMASDGKTRGVLHVATSAVKSRVVKSKPKCE